MVYLPIVVVIFGVLLAWHKYSEDKKEEEFQSFIAESDRLSLALKDFCTSYVVTGELVRMADDRGEFSSIVSYISLIRSAARKRPSLWTYSEKQAWAYGKEVFPLLPSGRYWGGSIVRQMEAFEKR